MKYHGSASESNILEAKSIPLVKVAVTADERDRVFQYRYSVYIETLGRSSIGANAIDKILHESYDDHTFLLYVESDGFILGTVSLLQSPFPAIVEKRIQINNIPGINAFKDDKKLFYISKFMVSKKGRNAEVSSALLSKAFWFSAALGGRIGFIHCSSSLKRFFFKWGCREYGEPFEFENVGTQYPLAISTTHRNAMLSINSPIMNGTNSLKIDEDSDLLFEQIVGEI